MNGEIEICECRVEDVNESVKGLWLGLAREMFEIEHFIVPSEINSDRWVKFMREGLASGKNLLLVAKCESRNVGFAFASVPRDSPFDVSKFFWRDKRCLCAAKVSRKGHRQKTCS